MGVTVVFISLENLLKNVIIGGRVAWARGPRRRDYAIPYAVLICGGTPF